MMAPSGVFTLSAPGVRSLRIAAPLEAGASQVEVARSPVVTVRGVLADDDPETGLPAGESAGDPAPLPRC
jgi:hypothetical protein